MCYIWVGSSSIWEIGKKEDKKEDHFWREHLPHRASRAPSQHVRALARMSDDIGPLRPAGEHKVFHDRQGHVAGAMSAQAAFAAPWASATVPAETHAQDHGWRRSSLSSSAPSSSAPRSRARFFPLAAGAGADAGAFPRRGMVSCLPPPYLKAHFNFSIVEYEKPVPVVMMITNPYVLTCTSLFLESLTKLIV